MKKHLDDKGLKAREEMFKGIIEKYGIEKLEAWMADDTKRSLLNAMTAVMADEK